MICQVPVLLLHTWQPGGASATTASLVSSPSGRALCAEDEDDEEGAVLGFFFGFSAC